MDAASNAALLFRGEATRLPEGGSGARFDAMMAKRPERILQRIAGQQPQRRAASCQTVDSLLKQGAARET